jgi:hypothetical protein
MSRKVENGLEKEKATRRGKSMSKECVNWISWGVKVWYSLKCKPHVTWYRSCMPWWAKPGCHGSRLSRKWNLLRELIIYYARSYYKFKRKKCSFCESSYCLLNCYIVSIYKWVMKFRRKLKSRKAKFMVRQHTHNPQTDGGRTFPPKRCSKSSQAEDLKLHKN